jgi:hypothetical protein
MTETYEQLRDTATVEDAEAWRAAHLVVRRTRGDHAQGGSKSSTQRLGPCALGGGGMIPIG